MLTTVHINRKVPKLPIFYEWLLRKSTLKLQKILQIYVRSFVNFHPAPLNFFETPNCAAALQLRTTGLNSDKPFQTFHM